MRNRASVAAACWPALSRLVQVVLTGRSIAVLITTLALGHANAIDLVPMLEVLAAEAGVAIEREDLLRRLHEQTITDPLTGWATDARGWMGMQRRERSPGRRRDAASGRRVPY